jgi:hypothetical protein
LTSLTRSSRLAPVVFLALICAICAFCAIAPRVAAQAPAPRPAALVIEGGTLIDGNGGAPVRDAVVIIQGNRITGVSRKGGQATYPAGAQVIKADGKFILPGLWDAQTIYNWYYAEPMLNYGITSTIGIGNSGEIGAPHRDAILHGKLIGPRPFTAMSQIVTRSAKDTGFETPLTPGRAPKSAQETRDLVKTFVAAGADMIIFQDGGLPLEYYQAGFDEAKKAGKPVFTRPSGPNLGPREAAMLGSRNFPHSVGIAEAVAKTPPAGRGVNELDVWADMDDAKAKDLIQLLVEHGTALTPTFKMQYPGYPKDWARFEQEDRKLLSDPNLAAYYPADRAVTAMATYNAIRIPPWCGALCADYNVPETPDVRERRMKGFQNALRFHKMFADAGGHLTPGGNTNATKVPGINMHHEMMIYAEAGIKPMQIIQGATKWSAQMIDKDKELGTVEVGKIADVIVVKQDPLADITNLRAIDTVIFDGKVVELGYHSWYSDPFRRISGYNPPVEGLAWAEAFRKAMFPQGKGPTALPDPVEAPQPAIETIEPVMLTEGTPSATVTIKGFNFVRKSQVLFKDAPVPYKVVSPGELQITIDASLLKDAGWFDLVVKNPWPLSRDTGQPWGNGTSNKAHLIINYRY